jgi:hypothetical protein
MHNGIGRAGAESLAGVLGQCQRWLTSISVAITLEQVSQRPLQECWRSAQRWLTSFSATKLAQCPALAHLDLSLNGSAMPEQTGSQECWRSAQRWLTSISATMRSDQPGQIALQECWGSAHHWLTLISNAMALEMASALSGKGGFELRGVVKPLALFCRHLALLARCHLFSRQTTRNSDILYTYSAVAFGLALSLSRKEVWNKRHDLYNLHLISSLWVVALLCIYAQCQSIRRRGVYLKYMSHQVNTVSSIYTFQH